MSGVVGNGVLICLVRMIGSNVWDVFCRAYIANKPGFSYYMWLCGWYLFTQPTLHMRLHTVWFSYTVLLTGIYPYMDALRYLKSRMQTAVSLLLLSSVLIVQDVRAQDPTVYNFPIGYTQCYSCQAGSYIESEGSGQCKACGPGFYQDVNGSTFCKACPEGEWKVPNAAVVFARVAITCSETFRHLQPQRWRYLRRFLHQVQSWHVLDAHQSVEPRRVPELPRWHV